MVQALPLSPADQLARTLANELPEPSRADFLRLTRALLHGPRFQWLLVETPSDALRDRVIAALDRVMLAAHLQSSRLPLDHSLTDVPALEAALVRHAKGCAVIHMLGRRGWFDAARWDAFNVRRERLAQEARARLVFWLDAEAIEAASMGAPDLWAWRSGVYSFADVTPAESNAQAAQVPVPEEVPRQVMSAEEGQLARLEEIDAWLTSSPNLPDELLGPPSEEKGRLLQQMGEYRKAIAHWYGDVLPLQTRRADPLGISLAWGNIAAAHEALGEFETALAIRRDRQLTTLRSLKHPLVEAATQDAIAADLAALGRWEEALKVREQEQLPLYKQAGAERLVALANDKIAGIRLALGEFDEAQRILQEEVLPVLQRVGSESDIAWAKGRIADILQARGQLDEALRIRQEEQLPVYEGLGDARGLAVTRWKIGLQLVEQGDPKRGEMLLRKAWNALHTLKLPEAAQLAEQMRAKGISIRDDPTP